MKVVPSRSHFAWATSILLIVACCVPAVAAARKPGDAALAKAPRAPSRTLSTVVKQRVPLPATVFNMCTGEDVLLDGDVVLTLNASSSTSGGTHLYFSADYFDSTAVGFPSGIRYVFSDVNHPFELNDPAGPPATFRAEDSQEVISVSPQVPNFIAHLTFLISVSPDFLPAATVENARVECTG